MPTIDIVGERYYIDMRLNEMRHVDDFMNRIFIHNDLYERGDKNLLVYDKDHKCVFRGKRKEFEERVGKGVVVVELPSQEKMDPVGFEQLCANIEQHLRDLDTLVPFAYEFSKAMEERRVEKQRAAARPLLEKKRERKNKGKRI